MAGKQYQDTTRDRCQVTTMQSSGLASHGSSSLKKVGNEST